MSYFAWSSCYSVSNCCSGALEVLRKQYKDLATRLDAQILAAHLYQRNAITVMDLQEIQSLRELPAKAAEKLLNIILVQPAAVYLYFLDALKDTNQRHVYESLVENSLKGSYTCRPTITSLQLSVVNVCTKYKIVNELNVFKIQRFSKLQKLYDSGNASYATTTTIAANSNAR